ncbi:MAG TPA: glycosyltransferase family 4 protein [Thermoplasmata archaeon]|nr:glycosyltransferase family 4 protein [Thermoplasmata archaeon]
MRILLIGGGVQPIPPTGYGAVERILADLAVALRAAGEDVEIVNQVRHGRTRDEIPFALSLPRLLRGERYDVLHAHTPVVANRLAFAGRPFVYTSHSRHWYYRTKWTHRWGYWLERRSVRRAGAVIALTAPLARTMRSVVRPPLPPISVVPFGVDAERFRPTWDRRTGRNALGVGVVAPFKRWHLAARAIEGTGATLSIAGPIVSPAYADVLRREGPHVRLLGEVPNEEMRTLFAESDFLLHPSEVEILSATVLEALAAALPVVGGAGVEGVVETGRTGWRLDDRDPETFVLGLRGRIQALVGDDSLRRTVGEEARAEALRTYGWAAIAARHLDVYRQLAARTSEAR